MTPPERKHHIDKLLRREFITNGEWAMMIHSRHPQSEHWEAVDGFRMIDHFGL